MTRSAPHRRGTPEPGALGPALALLLLFGCGVEPEARVLPSFGQIQALRPDNPASTDLFRFDPDETISFLDTPAGRFRVHFTRDGANAVPEADADQSGVPDFVEEAATIYEQVLSHYVDQLGFSAPLSDQGVIDNGGNDRFDVYLIDFGGQGDGAFRLDQASPDNPDAWIGYMIQENDFSGYGYPSSQVANSILASHEFFHAIQAAYDHNQGSVLAEGTAVWGTETFDPTLSDFEWLISGYLDLPDRPLDKPLPGPADPFSYGTALFFQFLSERYDLDLIRHLWEQCRNGAGGVADPYWLDQLPDLLATSENTTFAEAFIEFAQWNLFTAGHADAQRGYAGGDQYPPVRIDPVDTPWSDDALRLFHASTQYYAAKVDGRSQMTAALAADPETLADVTLLVTADYGDQYGEIRRAGDPAQGPTPIDTQDAFQLVTIVVNSATGGESRKPGLCIGSPDEVDQCRDRLHPTPAPAPPPSDSGGCHSSPGANGAGLGTGVLLAARRKRRHGARKSRRPCPPQRSTR